MSVHASAESCDEPPLWLCAPALGQPECGVWGPGRLAYGEQLSARALIIFQKQWHVVIRLKIENTL